ncbi:MAG: signal peptidase I [Planctomycetes bacterium]|nr:signal peptidase I [Planctomycetota bacterium]MCB9891260.1 signal peptidase I [Planctomycetota bacterium]MCB9919481.1 signal peptidase I [Planctomycetota bacterium]
MNERAGQQTETSRHEDALGHVVVLAVAVVTWWFLRSQVLQAYPVRTPSMEPTIEGDAEHPDLVLVDKTFDDRSSPQRFDTVVFREWDGDKILVKRVVGLPGEYLQIRGFDLWTGASPNALHRVVKSPIEHADLLIDYWNSHRDPQGLLSNLWRHDGASTLAENRLVIEGGARTADSLFPKDRFRRVGIDRTTAWRTAWQLDWQDGDILIGYLDASGTRRASTPSAIDFGVRMRVRATDSTSLWIDLRYGDSSWALRYEASGTVRLLANASEAIEPRDAPALDRDRDLVFMRLDGGFVLAVDDAIVFRHETELLDVREMPGRVSTWNGLGIGVTGPSVSIESVSVVLDMHYLEQGAYGVHEAHPIPGDAIYVLGDNSRDSRDSRHMGSVGLADLVGRPLAILAPSGRRHFLAR